MKPELRKATLLIILIVLISISCNTSPKFFFSGKVIGVEILDRPFWEYDKWILEFDNHIKIPIRLEASDIIEVGKNYHVYIGKDFFNKYYYVRLINLNNIK